MADRRCEQICPKPGIIAGDAERRAAAFNEISQKLRLIPLPPSVILLEERHDRADATGDACPVDCEAQSFGFDLITMEKRPTSIGIGEDLRDSEWIDTTLVEAQFGIRAPEDPRNLQT